MFFLNQPFDCAQGKAHLFRGSEGLHEGTVPEVYYYHSDHLGSSNVITNASGNQVQLSEYKPYGEFSQNTANNTHYYFTGKELDTTGLYYYGARYYDPRVARFITPDNFIAKPYNPQYLNRYSYCDSVGKPAATDFNLYLYAGNNPVNWVDPYGLWYIDINLSGGFWGGGTGGILIGPEGVYRYEGGGVVSPKVSGAIMWSPYDVEVGWNIGLQFVGGIAYQRSGAWADKKNPGWELGIGISYPTFWGASLTGYYVHEPWKWPWKRDKKDKNKKNNKDKNG